MNNRFSMGKGIFAVLLVGLGVLFQFDVFGMHTALSAFLPQLQSDGLPVLLGVVAAPFPITPELTAIAVAYKNEKYIADMVFPRVQVGKKEFKYRVFSKADSFTIPDTKVGRTSAPNRIEFGSTETSSFCKDNALDDPIPNEDIANAPEGYDVKGMAVASISDLILLDREKRASDLLFTLGTYASTNRTTLSGTSQFSHASSTPFDQVENAMDVCVMRPNIIVFGQAAWVAFKRHANTILRVMGSANEKGVVTQKMVAEALELDNVLVGQGWYNSAAKGQTATMARLWGDSCALIYQDKLADPRGRVSFGYTAQFGNRVAGEIEDKDIGMNGGVRVRAGESVRELVTANDLGYLFDDCVA